MAHDVLIVDDEADIRMLTAGILKDEGYDTREAANSVAALEAIQARRPHLVILDIWLQDSPLDGLAILERMRREHPNVPVVMISGHGTIETAVQAIKQGAYDFIEKPFKADRLLLVAERAIEAARLRRENQELRQRAGGEEELVGESLAIAQVRQAIDRVAPTGSRVLITGAAGSGKEIAARQLHRRSRRAGGPFVVLNCATMRPDRLEVELFGTESGSDADSAPVKVGTFEQAHGGTLLLDEVADMPLETQGKIVRVLQEQTFQRVGGNRRVEVDVRVIAATNRDLASEMSAGRLREDLYYRLNVVPLQIPALRERREDIPLLVQHFIARSADVNGLARRAVGAEALAALQGYDWPGNVRQLRNLIEWMLIMCPGDAGEEISAEMLPPEIVGAAPVALNGDAAAVMSLPLREAREVFERHYLGAQLMRFSRNISRTADFVGMERSALHRKLRLLGITGAERGDRSDG